MNNCFYLSAFSNFQIKGSVSDFFSGFLKKDLKR